MRQVMAWTRRFAHSGIRELAQVGLRYCYHPSSSSVSPSGGGWSSLGRRPRQRGADYEWAVMETKWSHWIIIIIVDVLLCSVESVLLSGWHGEKFRCCAQVGHPKSQLQPSWGGWWWLYSSGVLLFGSLSLCLFLSLSVSLGPVNQPKGHSMLL